MTLMPDVGVLTTVRTLLLREGVGGGLVVEELVVRAERLQRRDDEHPQPFVDVGVHDAVLRHLSHHVDGVDGPKMRLVPDSVSD